MIRTSRSNRASATTAPNPSSWRGVLIGAILGASVVALLLHIDTSGGVGEILLMSHEPPALAARPEETTTGSAATLIGWDPKLNPLAIPPGEAPPLPSTREAEAAVDATRIKSTKYGGAGDAKHLGGFTAYDGHGVSPYVWRQMMAEYGVHSVVDVGCGRGVSTSWFLHQGLDVLCVEGSHDAVTKSLLPLDHVVEHDFSRGPYWPAKTYDAAWSVEFLEHVSRQYHFNYLTLFRKAALIFVSSSSWGGWHHVEIHDDAWWIRKFELYGLRYDDVLTQQVRGWGKAEGKNASISGLGPDGKEYLAFHINRSIKVFINPVVAALPEHAHLFPQHGCYKAYPPIQTRPCTGGLETALPDSYLPLEFQQSKHEDWLQVVRQGLNITIGTTT
jgi:Methyltransferase domain